MLVLKHCCLLSVLIFCQSVSKASGLPYDSGAETKHIAETQISQMQVRADHASGDVVPVGSSMISGPYFGQTPPGLTPERFAAGIIPVDMMGCPVFTENGLEAYWSIGMNGQIQTSAEIYGQWTTPHDATFTAVLSGSNFPCLSPDGQRLFFTSSSYPGPDLDQKENVWVTERAGDGWGSPSPLPSTVNGGYVHWQLSVANNGNLYYGFADGSGFDIYVSQVSEGEYQLPQPLPPEINSSAIEQTPFIAPDESYIIFSRHGYFRSDPFPDLFISFRKADGSWTTAVGLDALNHIGADEICPNVTRDGRYLFFLSSIVEGLRTYWVSAEIIDSYRPGCCTGITGNVDADPEDTIDLGDLTALINYLFIDFIEPECVEEANVDGDVDRQVDLGDLTAMIDYLFITFTPPAECL